MYFIVGFLCLHIIDNITDIDDFCCRYSVSLGEALTEAVRKATITNLLIGLIWLIIFGMFALAFWYGSKLTREECMHSGALLQVFFGVLLGSLSLGQAMPLLENFGNAQGAAALLFKTIDDVSNIFIVVSLWENMVSQKLD